MGYSTHQPVFYQRPTSPLGGRYLIQEEAGRGGMGLIYRAWDQYEQRWVAVKLLHAMRQDIAVRFEREIRLLSSLGHPFIVRHFHQGVLDDGRRYMVMEWLEGETLADRLRRGSLSLDDAIALGQRVASALGVAHRQGVVHRDLKPSNIFLVDGRLEEPRILDFGIARDIGSADKLTASEAILGTPGYVAPEQARSSREADARADIYALGVTLYEAMTGCLPHGGSTPIERLMAPLQQPPTPLRQLRADASAELEHVFAYFLARDPQHRPADGDAAAAWLASVAPSASQAGGPLDTMPSMPPPRPSAPPAFAPGSAPSGQTSPEIAVAGSMPPPHTAMAMVDSLDSAPTRRAPSSTQRGPWPWIALASVMLVVGLGGGYWLSRGATPSAWADRDEVDPEAYDDDTSPRRRAKHEKRGPKSKSIPFDGIDQNMLCPSAQHCEVIPKRYWERASVAEAYDHMLKKAQEHYPGAEPVMFMAAAIRGGTLRPSEMTGGVATLSMAHEGRMFTVVWSMARVYIRADGQPAPPYRIGLVDIKKCTAVEAYRAVHGKLDASWHDESRSLILMAYALGRGTAIGPAWIIDNQSVPLDTCALAPP